MISMSGRYFDFILFAEIWEKNLNFILFRNKLFYDLFFRWGKYLSSPVTLPWTVACQFTWFNNIKIDNKIIFFRRLSNNDLNFVGQLFDFDWSIKSYCLKDQLWLKNTMQFKCCQTKHAILQLWKDDIKNFTGNLNNLSIQDHHLIHFQPASLLKMSLFHRCF